MRWSVSLLGWRTLYPSSVLVGDTNELAALLEFAQASSSRTHSYDFTSLEPILVEIRAKAAFCVAAF